MKKLQQFIVDNSLSLVMICLFVLCLVGQAYSGVLSNNQLRAMHGEGPTSVWKFIETGTFMQGVFENWQAAILQLGSLIIFGVFLRQRGAPHSRQMQQFRPSLTGSKEGTQSGQQQEQTSAPKQSEQSGGDGKSQPTAFKRGTWLHRNSLSVTFMLLFCSIFVLHMISGAAAYSEQLAYLHRPPVHASHYLFTSQFWSPRCRRGKRNTWPSRFTSC